MFKKIKIIFFPLSVDLILFLISCLSFYFIIQKAGLPFSISEKENSLIVSSLSLNNQLFNNRIVKGDLILSINELRLNGREEAELLLDGKKIGEQVELKLSHNGRIFYEKITLIKYYKNFDIIFYAVTGLLFFIIGIFVLYKCSEKKSARIFHWASICTAMVIMMTPGNYSIDFYGMAYIIKFLFILGYCLVPSIFIHFTYVFPNDEQRKYKEIFLSYGISFIFAAGLSIVFILAVRSSGSYWINSYIGYFNIFRIFIIACILFAIFNFIRTYRKTEIEVEKKKLKWILYGFVVGPGSYVVFWVLPHLFFGQGLLPEALVIILFTAVPITFTIAIVKYHLMNIDLIINRSVVYALVIASLIVIYAVCLVFITNLLNLPFSDKYSSVTAGVIVALLFQPVRIQVQKFVDKKFFRVQYDFRRAINQFFEEIKEINTIQTLAEKIIERTEKLIPVKKIGFFLLTPDNRIKLIAHKNFDLLIRRSIRFEAEKLKTNLSLPVAVKSKIESGIMIELADEKVFGRWGMCLVFPVKSIQGEIYAFVVLGEKKSDRKFTAEDVDLLNTVASRAAATFERIKLQEELIREHLESERLDALNKLKSFFVSRVSHDFKTPLTSIKIFSELLRDNKDLSEQIRKEYLEIIEGESDKLTLLINNVLDFSKIEKGASEYCFEKTRLNGIVEDVLRSVNYQIKMQKCETEVQLYKNESYIYADKIAVGEAITNLITNAIKYSGESKKIKISTIKKDDYMSIIVEDNGIGISEKELKDLFQPFFRSKNSNAKKVKGTGLGLTIVKHIMDAHKGSIEVKSELNKGSCFTLNFPLILKNEDINS
ncbi:MAG: ATP-binding protein [Ignavibacteria bacterium]